MKEIQKCVYTYKNFWNSCTPPSVSFTYDGSITWLDFLNLISRLQLNDSVVSVDFDEDVVIDYSWRCQLGSTNSVSDRWRSYNSQSRSTLSSVGIQIHDIFLRIVAYVEVPIHHIHIDMHIVYV